MRLFLPFSYQRTSGDYKNVLFINESDNCYAKGGTFPEKLGERREWWEWEIRKERWRLDS